VGEGKWEKGDNRLFDSISTQSFHSGRLPSTSALQKNPACSLLIAISCIKYVRRFLCLGFLAEREWVKKRQDYSHSPHELAVEVNAKRILVEDPEKYVYGYRLQHRKHSLLIGVQEFIHHVVSFHFHGAPDEGAGCFGFGGV
jgi:hypothetical protein